MRFISNYVEKFYPAFERLFSNENDGGHTLSKVLFNILAYAVILAASLIFIDLIIIYFTEKGGVFGDFLGGVLNPIFTFLTLFGLIVTIVIQRQELRLARIEYEKTADALSTHAIETTFFNILDLHHNIVDNLKVDVEELRYKSFFNSLAKEVSSAILKESRESIFKGRAAFDAILGFIASKTGTPEEVVERYKSLQDEHNHVLGHYFRNLYQALKIIDGYDNDKLSFNDKRKYTSILRAQLSTIELALLFINCIEGVSDKGQFKNLLIEYSMLEHLPITKVDAGFLIANRIIVTNDMLSEYKSKIKLGIELKKYYGGAFGKNGNIPYDFKATTTSNLDSE